MKERDCTIYVAKTKALISFAVTAKVICVFVFAYAKCWFSHDAAHIIYPIVGVEATLLSLSINTRTVLGNRRDLGYNLYMQYMCMLDI